VTRVFTHTSQDVATLVGRRLGAHVTSIAPFEHGISNAVYFVALKDQPECVVRVSRQQDRDYVALELWAFDHCRAAGVPVPTVLAADCAPSDFPEPFIITRRVPGLLGDSAELTLDQQRAAYEDLGRHMARLHGIQLPGYGELRREGATFAGPCTSWWERLLAELDVYAPTLTQNVRGAAVLEDARRRLEVHRALFDLPTASLVHGDLQGKNFLVHGTSVAAVLDFECAEAGDPVMDFRVFRYWDTKREALTQAMLRGYGEAGTDPDDTFHTKLSLYELLYALLILTGFYRESNARRIEDTFSRITRIHRELDSV
jgi:aminoglycoside phosphotransferase (APT) family kinase protein